MRYGISLPPFGPYADARAIAQLARDAEQAGWDGFFLWDHVLLFPWPTVDPWVTMTAIALSTERIRFGALVTPLPRRRPIKLAREIVTLDHLSNGRLIFGVGIGVGPWEWDYLREETDLRTRGDMLDEGLDLLARLWTGEPVVHHGRFYDYRGDGGPDQPEERPVPFLPRPFQQPRVPTWVAGVWPNKRPFRRAAQWDGLVPLKKGYDLGQEMTPDDLREIVAYTRAHRTSEAPFDVTVGGHTPGRDRARDADHVAARADAGATWWIEDISPWPYGWQWQGDWPVEAMNARIRQGPPRA
jgi:alkanesulfonate monooxygenase SsuD/methylene tetrahydromethanopterin reductase-like flavin-dependent oxidoreductase (luciferase family)